MKRMKVKWHKRKKEEKKIITLGHLVKRIFRICARRKRWLLCNREKFYNLIPINIFDTYE